MKIHTFTTEQWLPTPIDDVFAFFADARNLEILTPPWLHFQILSEDLDVVRQGMEIEYRIRWRWIPLRWLTEITDWQPPYRFVDTQRRGPYRQWIHEHTFEEVHGGTLVKDEIDYAIPGWILEPLVHRWVVGPDVAKIFEYRQEQMLRQFSS